ncbi:MAG: RNA polymerase sigma factor [Planctomycetes bacterium]|nr:RNA polymerase sigma factor [Planctomycetota bacterium]
MDDPKAPGSRRDPQAGLMASAMFDAAGSSDEVLLSRLAEGKGRETALPELFARHGDRALRLARNILGDWQTSEEAVQDAFLRLAEKAHLWRGDASFNTFFTKLLVNVCRSRRRRGHDAIAKGNLVGSPSQVLGGVAASSRITDLARQMQAEELRRTVRGALDKLPEKFREVLVLRELEGLDYKAIAEIQDATLDEVRIWIYRGRQRLRAILEGREGEFFE